ncbi:ciliogenesis and planar polarity effector 2 isoform X1 [Passer domesticus]|uniref:ciliogenesis and planar polarity effector 2 isoform X1 n=1 Tax=Passer domesticus TaxID=48849 RepID=UPI0030FE11F7
MLGHRGCFREPMEDLWTLGRVLGAGVGSEGDPKAADAVTPWGRGAVRRPPGRGAHGRAGLGAGAGLAAVPRRPPLPGLHPAQEPAENVRSAGAPGAAARAGCPHGHLQTLPGGQERRRQDSAGGLAGGDPRAPRPPRDPGHRGHHAVLAGQTPRQQPPRPVPAAALGLRGRSAQEACKEEADAALLLFSFTDRASFEELPALMGRVLGPEDSHLVRVVVGTKFDLAPHAAVTEGDVRALEGTRGLRVLRAGGSAGAGGARAGLARVAPVLDALVEELWRRDQVTAGVTPGDTGDTPT